MSQYFTDPAIQEIEQIAERVNARLQPSVKPQGDVLDEKTLERIRLFNLISHKPYLTRAELAIYLDVDKRSITEWAARQPDHNPLPVRNAGSEPRYRREDIDKWAEREAQRRRMLKDNGVTPDEQ